MGVCESNSKNNKKIKRIDSQSDDNDYILSLKYSKRKNISEDYKIDSNFIGRGASGEVYIAKDKNGLKYAIKRINKLSIKFKNSIINEAKISQNVNHPHIVKCYGVYEDLKSISFVLELIEGGDLFDFIKKYPGEHLDDDIALEILIQILETINYLHNELNICHRDIKLENFLVSIENDKPIIKMIDFGLSCYIPENNLMNEIVGSPYYQAPEILEGAYYSKMIDMWSTGILFYTMLLGYPPFDGNDKENLQEHILYDKINFNNIENKELRELCEGLLEKHPDFRLNVVKALKKAYEVYENITNDETLSKIREDFLKLDTQKLGYVTLEQINHYYNIDITKYDININHKILNFSDFAHLITGIL